MDGRQTRGECAQGNTADGRWRAGREALGLQEFGMTFFLLKKKNGGNFPELSKVSPKFYRGWLPIDGRAGKESKWEQ